MTIRILASLLLLTVSGTLSTLRAADPSPTPVATAAAGSVEYKMLSGYKQPFNDDLQLHLSQGWTPSGGVSVTVWNNDLYFAVLLSRPAQSSH